MPFFPFQRSSTAAAAAAAAGAHHHRQLSLSSSPKDARIAEIRAETVAMANSGELTLSRSKTSSGHTLRSNTSGRMHSSGHSRPLQSSGHRAVTAGGSIKVHQRIVAMEPDEDSSRHSKRIDQGILDASREALEVGSRLKSEQQLQQNQQQGGMTSWWNSLSYYAGTGTNSNVVSPGSVAGSPSQQQQLQKDAANATSSKLNEDEIFQHKTTVSRKFRV
jgi:hypothetical protein